MQRSPAEDEALLRLAAVPGIGPSRLRTLVGHFRSASAVFKSSPRELAQVAGVDVKTIERISSVDGRANAKRQQERLHAVGARMMTFWDADYPALLKQIYDPPAVLFIKGQLEESDELAIGIVGTRQPSRYGRLVAEKLTAELSSHGLTIVSGLAYGIDTVAHQWAMKSGGRTVAVLGSGLDHIYPPENKKLSEHIAGRGALISEFAMGAGPDRSNFPRRNRLICGLSLGVVVVEAGQKSGALITAGMALEQNREVFAVPGNIYSKTSAGSNLLIKEGAQVVTETEDILRVLAPRLKRLTHERPAAHTIPDISAGEKAVLSSLSNEPRHIDEIARALKLSTSQVLASLLSLELKNLVRQQAGKLFVRL